MDRTTSNPCTTCGKQRVVVRTYREKVGGSVVVHTLTVCPDPACQEKINTQLAKEKRFREDLKVASEKRIQEKKENALNK